MDYQLEFPFIKNHYNEFPCEGIVDSVVIVSEYLSSGFKNASLKQRAREIKRFESMIHSSQLNGDLFEENFVGFRLLPDAAEKYFPENFYPSNWIHDAEVIQQDRRILKLCALKRDLSESFIMIKSPKYNVWGGSNGVSEISVQKSSEKELQTLVELQSKGVAVEPPLGFFQQGQEQYVYTEFVEGVDPRHLLAGKDRLKVWEADAFLLSSILKAGFKHQLYYSKDFDDKIWKDDKLVLIDTDETKHIDDWPHEGYFSEHPESLPDYYVSNLLDCISSYCRVKMMKEDEAAFYAKKFLQFTSIKRSLSELMREVKPDRITEESHIGMMCDCS